VILGFVGDVVIGWYDCEEVCYVVGVVWVVVVVVFIGGVVDEVEY